MRRCLGILCLLIVLAPVVRAEEPKKQKVLREVWDAAYADSVKVGYFHTVVREIEDDTGKFVRATVEMELDIRRDKTTVKIRAATGDDETTDGKVTGVTMIQPLDSTHQLEIRGKVIGKQLRIKVNDPPTDKMVPWD